MAIKACLDVLIYLHSGAAVIFLPHPFTGSAYVENDRANNFDNLAAAPGNLGLTTETTREVEISTRCWWDKN